MKVNISKNLGKQLEQLLQQSYHRLTTEKGLDFGKLFWQAVFKDEKQILEIGKTIIAKTTPTTTEHTGESLVDQSVRYTIQIVKADGSKTDVPFTRKPNKSLGEPSEI